MTPFILHRAQGGTEYAALHAGKRPSRSPRGRGGDVRAADRGAGARRDRLEAPSVASGDFSPAAARRGRADRHVRISLRPAPRGSPARSGFRACRSSPTLLSPAVAGEMSAERTEGAGAAAVLNIRVCRAVASVSRARVLQAQDPHRQGLAPPRSTRCRCTRRRSRRCRSGSW